MDRDIIAIGGSAGGIEAVSHLLSLLPAGLAASLFVVVHLSPHRDSGLDRILSRACKLPVSYGTEGQPVERGHVYVAPPDKHLLVQGRVISLGTGPRENRVRPSIDVLFRSAAHAFDKRVVGIILSGSSDDGTAGLVSIKRHGGFVIAQNPEEAQFARMPQTAAQIAPADAVLRIADIAALITELVAKTNGEDNAGKPGELHPFDTSGPGLFRVGQIPPTPLTCPACGGAVWELSNQGLSQFACHQGHRFTSSTMLEEYDEQVGIVLGVVNRILEEVTYLRMEMAARARLEGRVNDAEKLETEAGILRAKAAILKNTLPSN